MSPAAVTPAPPAAPAPARASAAGNGGAGRSGDAFGAFLRGAVDATQGDGQAVARPKPVRHETKQADKPDAADVTAGKGAPPPPAAGDGSAVATDASPVTDAAPANADVTPAVPAQPDGRAVAAGAVADALIGAKDGTPPGAGPREAGSGTVPGSSPSLMVTAAGATVQDAAAVAAAVGTGIPVNGRSSASGQGARPATTATPTAATEAPPSLDGATTWTPTSASVPTPAAQQAVPPSAAPVTGAPSNAAATAQAAPMPGSPAAQPVPGERSAASSAPITSATTMPTVAITAAVAETDRPATASPRPELTQADATSTATPAPQVLTVDRPPAAQPAAVAQPAAPPSASQPPLGTQLARPVFTLAAAGAGEHVMTVHVTPDALGPVTVRAHVGGEGVRVELFAPTDAGRDAIRAILPDLRRDLTGSGLTGTLDLSSQSQPSPQQDAQAGARHGRPDQHPGEPRTAVGAASPRSTPPAAADGSSHTIDVIV